MKYVDDMLCITAEDFECIEENWSLGDEVNGPHDWKYRVLNTKPYGRRAELTTFVFFMMKSGGLALS